MTVVTEGDGKFRDAAETIAERRGDVLSPHLTDVEPGEPVLYVASPDEIREEKLLVLQQRLLERGPRSGAFSVITGFTPEDAIALYERSTSNHEGHCLAMRDCPDGFESTDDCTFLGRNRMTVENLREAASGGLESLGLLTGGFPIHLFLSDGLMCGFPRDVDPRAYGGSQPYCVDSEGSISCPLDGELLRAVDLEVSHVFIASCASMIGNGTSGLPVHVGTGLLSNAESMIGSYRVSPSSPYELVLHYSLLRAGYDLVERCYIMNKHSHLNGIMGYPYVPFGHPSAGLEPAESGGESIAFDRDDDTLRLTAADAYVADASIDVDDLPPTDERYYLTTETDGGARYYTSFPEGDSVRLLLYDGNRMSTTDQEIAVHARQPTRSKLDSVFDFVHNFERHGRLGLLDDELSTRYADFRSRVYAARESVTPERFSLVAHTESTATVEDLIDEMNDLSSDLLEHLHDGRFIMSSYASRAIDWDVFPADANCPHCSRPLFVKEIADFTETVFRAAGFCPRCAQSFDVPTEPGETDPARLSVSGAVYGTTDAERTIHVTVDNPRDVAAEVHVRPMLWGFPESSREGKPIFEPAERHVRLGPGRSATLDFTVSTSTLEDNQYYVTTRAAINGEFYSEMGTTMVVGDATGYKPPYLL